MDGFCVNLVNFCFFMCDICVNQWCNFGFDYVVDIQFQIGFLKILVGDLQLYVVFEINFSYFFRNRFCCFYFFGIDKMCYVRCGNYCSVVNIKCFSNGVVFYVWVGLIL